MTPDDPKKMPANQTHGAERHLDDPASESSPGNPDDPMRNPDNPDMAQDGGDEDIDEEHEAQAPIPGATEQGQDNEDLGGTAIKDRVGSGRIVVH